MSRYTDLRDRIADNAGSSGSMAAWNNAVADFTIELLDAADDMQRLWDMSGATVRSPKTQSFTHECLICNEPIGSCEPDCPREALRPLFGEVEG